MVQELFVANSIYFYFPYIFKFIKLLRLAVGIRFYNVNKKQTVALPI